MKRNFLLLLFSGITLLSCNSKSDFYYLHGAIKEKDVQTLYLISSNQVIDSASVDEKGAFQMHGFIEKPILAYIADARNTREASLSYNVILEPGTLLTMVKLGKYDQVDSAYDFADS